MAKGIRTSQETIDKIVGLRNEGKSYDDIEAETGIARSTIHKYLKHIELSPETKEGIRVRYKEKISKIMREKPLKEVPGLAEFNNDLVVQTEKITGNYNSKHIGNRSVAHIMCVLLDNYISVSIPYGDNDRYDLIAEQNKKLYRIQCRTARYIRNGTWTIKTTSVQHSKTKNVIRDFHDDVELFAAYIRELDVVIVFDISIVKKTSVSFTLKDFLHVYNQRTLEDFIYDPSKSLDNYK